MDTQTLERVYQAELGAVHAFLSRLGAPRGDVSDLLHDVFLTAVKRWSSYDPQRPVRPLQKVKPVPTRAPDSGSSRRSSGLSGA